MKKRYKTIIIIAIILFLTWIGYINSSYYRLQNLYNNPLKTNQEYKDFIYNEYSTHITITSYEGQETELVIPNYINDKPVYAIDDSAFYGNSYLEKVEIPSTVIRIGHQTFIGNAKLKEVILPNNLSDIGEWSFEDCPMLEKIYVKKGSKTDKTLKKLPFKQYIVYK